MFEDLGKSVLVGVIGAIFLSITKIREEGIH